MILCISLNPAVDKMVKLDSIQIGSVNRGSLESVHAGGKAVNVAYDLVLQGDDVILSGFVGGKAGSVITEELKKRRIPFDFIKAVGETRTNMNYIDSAGNITEILEGGHMVDARGEEEFLHLFRKLLDKADMVVLSGSLPAGLNDDFYASLIDLANRREVPVALDASGESLVKAASHHPFLIKPNIREFEYLTGHSYDLSTLDENFDAFIGSGEVKDKMLPDLKLLRSLGIMVICVTFGKQGMLLYVKDEIVFCNAPKVDVVNTVGSGDCILASLIHSFLKNASVHEAAVYASAVASAHVTTLNVGDVDPKLVSELTKKVKRKIINV